MTVDHVKFADTFKYLQPGVLFPPSAGGAKTMKHSRYLAAPNMSFPFKLGGTNKPAFMQSIVGSYGGCAAPSGNGFADKRNLMHPDRDNFGEMRGYPNPFASDRKGHQGCDVRNPSAKNGTDQVIAIEAGRVVRTSTSGGVVEIETLSRERGGSGTLQVYRHMNPIFVGREDKVEAGQPIGIAGSRMGGKDNNTFPHLHLELRTNSIVLPASGSDGQVSLSDAQWGIVLPCYPSLVAAKMRALDLEPKIVGNQLMPDPRFEVSLEQFRSGDYSTQPAPPESDVVTAPPAEKHYESYWTIERPGKPIGVLGLVVGQNDERSLYLLTPRETMFERRSRTRLRGVDELIFKGRLVRDAAFPVARSGPSVDVRAADTKPARLEGEFTWLDPNRDVSKRCPNKTIRTDGLVLDDPARFEFPASTPIYDDACKEVSQQDELYTIMFYGSAPPKSDQASDAPPVINDKDRKTIVEITRNWGAISMRTPHQKDWLIQAVAPKFANDPSSLKIPQDNYKWVYVGDWPGLRLGGEMSDKLGNTVPAFSSDEAGVALWWFWVRKRKADRFTANGNPTFRQIAQIYGGDGASQATINNYLNEYKALARKYFRSELPTPDAPIDLSNPDQRHALAWTMFHHEAGNTPLIDRTTFEDGVRMAEDLIAKKFSRLCDYQRPRCGTPEPEPAPSETPPVSESGPIVIVRPEPPKPNDGVNVGEVEALRRELLTAHERIEYLERQLAMRPGQSARVVRRYPQRPCRSDSGWLFCTGP